MAGPAPSCIYVAKTDESLRNDVFELCLFLREKGFRVEADYQARSLKSQFKQADKLNAKVVLVLGPDEVATHTVSLRNMEEHTQENVKREDLLENLEKLF